MEQTRTCKKCLIEYDLNKEFFPLRKSTSGKILFRFTCQLCLSDYRKEYRLQNREELNDYSKLYREQNLEKCKESSKNWRKNNREALLLKKKEYYQLHKREQMEKQRKKDFLRRHNDPAYNLRRNISRDVWRGLKKQNKRKTHPTWSKLNYSPQQLKEHLESLFEHWMNWENYGVYEQGKQKWNIDHIVPQSKLIYDSMEHPNFLECWKLENLRPLEIIENIRKSDNELENLVSSLRK